MGRSHALHVCLLLLGLLLAHPAVAQVDIAGTWRPLARNQDGSGMTGDAESDLHWRWTQTPEQRLLAQAADEPAALPPAPAVAETSKEQLATKADDKAAARWDRE